MDLRARIQQLIDSFPLQEIDGEDIKVEAIFHEFVSRIPVGERREAERIIRELMLERRELIGKNKHTGINLKEQLKGIEGVISMSYIAHRYFGKDKEWLWQRINSEIINGEPAVFVGDELDRFKLALYDIRNKLSQAITNIS